APARASDLSPRHSGAAAPGVLTRPGRPSPRRRGGGAAGVLWDGRPRRPAGPAETRAGFAGRPRRAAGRSGQGRPPLASRDTAPDSDRCPRRTAHCPGGAGPSGKGGASAVPPAAEPASPRRKGPPPGGNPAAAHRGRGRPGAARYTTGPGRPNDRRRPCTGRRGGPPEKGPFRRRRGTPPASTGPGRPVGHGRVPPGGEGRPGCRAAGRHGSVPAEFGGGAEHPVVGGVELAGCVLALVEHADLQVDVGLVLLG